MMRYLALLCFVTTATAGTGGSAVFEAQDDSLQQRESFPFPHPWSPLSRRGRPSFRQHTDLQDQETMEEDRPWHLQDSHERSVEGDSALLNDIQKKLKDDLLRMEQDLLQLHFLLGIGNSNRSPVIFTDHRHPPVFHAGPRPPPVFSTVSRRPSFFPWRPSVVPHDFWGSESNEEDHSGEVLPFRPGGGGGGSPWFRFPGLGFDRPIFPDLPNIPSVPRVDDLPDNYNNSTHQVHKVNGTRVEVNTTTNKQSGDGFNTFVHHQVIHIHPDQDSEGQQPNDLDPVVTTTTTTPDEEKVASEVEEEVMKGEGEVPVLPEVENEVHTDKDPTVWKLPEVLAEVQEGSQRVLRGAAIGRSLSGHSAAYAINDIYSSEDDDETPKPDLSSDTRVNHVSNENQGISMVDPEAEIFDLGLVIKEAKLNAKENE